MDACTKRHETQAEVGCFTCLTILANKWSFMDNGDRIFRSGISIRRVSVLTFITSNSHNWLCDDLCTRDEVPS